MISQHDLAGMSRKLLKRIRRMEREDIRCRPTTRWKNRPAAYRALLEQHGALVARSADLPRSEPGRDDS